MTKTCQMDKFPVCDMCGKQAQYDGKTYDGYWAMMCANCLAENGIGLGLGKGQMIVFKEE